MTERLHFHFHVLEKENGNPLQCSCLENPRDGGAWWAAVCGVTQSQTLLKRLSSSSSSNFAFISEGMWINGSSLSAVEIYWIISFWLIVKSGNKKNCNIVILCFILKTILYPTLESWRIADWQCYANFFCRAKLLSYAYIDFLFYFIFHYGLPLDIEYSSLCYPVTQRIFKSQFCAFLKSQI